MAEKIPGWIKRLLLPGLSSMEGELGGGMGGVFSLRLVYLILLSALVVLVPLSNLVYAQYPPAVLTISPLQLQVGGAVNFDWSCPGELPSWYYYTLPFIYAQITINRVQELPTALPQYNSPYLPSTGGPFSYTPPTAGTFTVILRCHYLGTPIGLGDFSCSTSVCKSGGEFIVTSPQNAP
jgi:hypothetical protein